MDLEEKIIEMVRSHPALYDLKSELYKNIALKSRLWAEIGSKVGLVGEACQKRWMGLRSCYRRAKRTEQVASGSGATLKKKWRYYEAISFLDEVQCCRRTIGHVGELEEPVNLSPKVEYETPQVSIPSPSTSSAIGGKKNKIDTHLEKFLQNATDAIRGVSDAFLNRSCQTTTGKVFASLARVVEDANLDAVSLNNFYRRVSDFVYNELSQLSNQ